MLRAWDNRFPTVLMTSSGVPSSEVSSPLVENVFCVTENEVKTFKIHPMRDAYQVV